MIGREAVRDEGKEIGEEKRGSNGKGRELR